MKRKTSRKRSKSKTFSGAAKFKKSVSESCLEITDTMNTYNPMQNLDFIRSTSL